MDLCQSNLQRQSIWNLPFLGAGKGEFSAGLRKHKPGSGGEGRLLKGRVSVHQLRAALGATAGTPKKCPAKGQGSHSHTALPGTAPAPRAWAKTRWNLIIAGSASGWGIKRENRWLEFPGNREVKEVSDIKRALCLFCDSKWSALLYFIFYKNIV